MNSSRILFSFILFVSLFTFSQLHAQNSVWTWGSNQAGQLGNGMRDYDLTDHRVNTAAPAPVTCYDDWLEISAGSTGVLAIRQDGTLWSWGNTHGLGLMPQQLDFGGNASLPPGMAVAAQVGNGSDWTSISHKGNVSAAIYLNGTLWMWGANTVGELGNGTANSSPYPAQVSAMPGFWTQVVAGFTTLALQSNGTLWTWGAGALRGVGVNQNVNAPTQAGTDTDWHVLADMVTGASHAAAIKTNGSLWTWGANAYGQLGLGANTGHLSPQQVGTATNWKSVSVGQDYTVAIKTDGTLWAWGRNHQGQLGDGTNIDRTAPVQIGAANNWKEVSGGGSYTIAVKTDGTLWAWGSNLTTMVYTNTPQQIGTSTEWSRVSAGTEFGVALRNAPHDPMPNGIALPNDVNSCQDFYEMLPSVQNADSYKWYKDNTPIQLSGTPGIYGIQTPPGVVNSGTYRLVVNQAGCRSSDEIQVTLHGLPPVTYSMQGPKIEDCTTWNHYPVGSTVTFTNTTADAATGSFQWVLEDANGTVSTSTGPTFTFTFNDMDVFVVDLHSASPCHRYNSSYGPIIIQPRLSLGPDAVIDACQAPVALNSNITDGQSYTWTKPDNSQETGQLLSADQSGVYTLAVDRLLCVQRATVTVDLSGMQSLDFNPAGSVLAACPDQFNQANAITFNNATPEAAGHDFTWTFGDGTTTTSTDATHAYTAPGRYNVTLDGSCNRTLTKEVVVQPVLSLGDDRFACEASVPLATNIPSADSYSWQTPDGSTISGQPSITATAAGTYNVTVVKLGCTQTDAVTITTATEAVNAAFNILAGGTPIGEEGSVLNGIPLTFASTGNTAFQHAWTFGDGATAQEHNIEHTYASTGNYTVKLVVTDKAGCTGETEKFLHVQDLIITDAISPNGDGKNDRLVITPYLYEANLRVMDRAGRTVFEASPYNNDFSGQNLESDVYFYELQIKETGKSFKGYLHIMK
jgi:gliding motility-associated-like protein